MHELPLSVGFGEGHPYLVNYVVYYIHGVIMTRTDALGHLFNISEVLELFVFEDKFHVSKCLDQRNNIETQIVTDRDHLLHVLDTVVILGSHGGQSGIQW